MAWLSAFLITHPELTVFLALGLGAAIGRVKVHGFGLGTVTGSLFAGILIGQFAEVPVSGTAKSLLFLLFMFGIGYEVGPQFLGALRRNGLQPVLVALVCCFTGLGTALVMATLLGLDVGFAAGMLSGGLTESPAIGTASEAIAALPLPEEERARLIAHVAVADAVTYLFGALGAILFCSLLGPKLLGVDLKAEARRLEDEIGLQRQGAGVVSAWRRFELRAFRLDEASPAAGLTVAQAEALLPGQRAFILRLRRGETLSQPTPETPLAAGDVIAVAARREVLVDLIGPRAREVEDQVLLDVPALSADVLVTQRQAVGRTIDELGALPEARGVFLRAVVRGQQDLPVVPGLRVERGDLLRLAGPEPSVLAAAARLGPVIRPSTETDFVVLGLGIFLGGLFGVLASISIGGIHVSLGTAVGTLVIGLGIGHMRTRLPLFGRIPQGAVHLMTTLGLAAFVAMTGLHAGPVFFSALAEAGIGLLFGGMVVTAMPLFAGLYFGRYVLRMNPVLLLGAIAGAMTMTPAMAAVQERSDSPVAVLGYTPAEPIAHVLLTTWGTLIVRILAG